jgi:hypothetical protein
MQIIGVYNKLTKKYTQECISQLTSLGFSATAIDMAEYTYDHEITSYPSFLLVKEEKAGYALTGKQSIDTVIDWANRSGAICN